MRINFSMEESEKSRLPGGILVTPALRHLHPGRSVERLSVEISNVSCHAITFPAKSCLCELHQVSVMTENSDGNFTKSERVRDNEDQTFSDFRSDFTESLQAHLTALQVNEVQAMIGKWSDVFSQHDLDLGQAKGVKHRIRLTDENPFKERSRRIPPNMIEDVRSHLQEMSDLGVIRHSESPYGSNVVLVRRKDGKLRFCIDLRRLNSVTVKDAYSLPRIDDSFDALSGAKWLSTLDLKSAYWQVELAEEDREKTAFTVGPLGFWECNRMPFGLTNAPATF